MNPFSLNASSIMPYVYLVSYWQVFSLAEPFVCVCVADGFGCEFHGHAFYGVVCFVAGFKFFHGVILLWCVLVSRQLGVGVRLVRAPRLD